VIQAQRESTGPERSSPRHVRGGHTTLTGGIGGISRYFFNCTSQFLVAEEETFDFEWYRPTGLLLLTLVLRFVASTVGQTNPNHLAREQSRYLSRAMNQPVDWYPWGADPFKRAKERHRPILLDVGAVWCPWCALMDRDTYTNVDSANYINQHFVAVKVDFDVSPKLVAQLQQAQAVLNPPAGLPLTSFITPDGRLYFGAGYLPAERKNGKPSFRETADEALARFANRYKIEEQSFQLELEE
jgi:hypothetical protein